MLPTLNNNKVRRGAMNRRQQLRSLYDFYLTCQLIFSEVQTKERTFG